MREGKREVVQLPLEQYPCLLHFPRFETPAFLSPEDYECGIRLTGVATVLFGPRPEVVAARLGAEEISISSKGDRPVAFARMIAKIAYAYAVAEHKIGLLDGAPFVLPAILGAENDIGRWVGTLGWPPKKYAGLLHRLLIREDHEKGLLVGEVQLFADSQAPSYGVILGKLR